MLVRIFLLAIGLGLVSVPTAAQEASPVVVPTLEDEGLSGTVTSCSASTPCGAFQCGLIARLIA